MIFGEGGNIEKTKRIAFTSILFLHFIFASDAV